MNRVDCLKFKAAESVRLDQFDQDEADGRGTYGGESVKGHGLAADAAQLRPVTEAYNGTGDGEKHQRRNEHVEAVHEQRLAGRHDLYGYPLTDARGADRFEQE